MTAFTEPDRMTLEFCLSQKEIINSNMTFKHFMQKAVMVDNLRSKSAETGSLKHPQSELVCKYLEDLDTEKKNAAARNRLMKSLKKDKDITQEEIDREIALLESTMDTEPSLSPEERSIIQPLFSHFGVSVTVCPPTRRRLDPPNLYPTVKAWMLSELITTNLMTTSPLQTNNYSYRNREVLIRRALHVCIQHTSLAYLNY